MKHIGLFGGTFNPIHYGHIRAIQELYHHTPVDSIICIPSKIPPHKQSAILCPAHHRLAMIQHALKQESAITCSDIEIQRPAPSYTIDTIRYFRSYYPPSTNLLFYTGADSLQHLHKWKQIADIVHECQLIIFTRPGHNLRITNELIQILPKNKIKELEKNIVSITTPSISSTEIRTRIKNNQDIHSLVPSSIAEYIYTNKLYA